MDNPIDRRVATALRSYTVLAIIALLVGATVVAPLATGVVGESESTVAVVSVDETITSSSSQSVIRKLRDLRGDSSVAAVVLRVSSPGGSASASESLYLAVKRLAAEKPVYTSVGQYAASGAYYTSVPSDAIYVTPGSIVGHVGVIATAPPEGLAPVAATGPDKAHRGMTRDQFYASIESMKRAFVGAVMDERGDRITVSRETVAEASAYTGTRAVRTGYADEVGGLEATIAAAAADAGVSNYDVEYHNPAQSLLGVLLGANAGANASANATVASPFEHGGVDSVHFLMIYGTPENGRVVYDTAAEGEDE